MPADSKGFIMVQATKSGRNGSKDGKPGRLQTLKRGKASNSNRLSNSLHALTWYDLGEPFLMHSFPRKDPKMHDVCWVCIPAYGARLTLNDRFAKGRPFPDSRGDRQSSTCGAV